MKGDVRVRFAPSPTGPLHIGNARTALFNRLFAAKEQGVMVLRIEDTDLARSNPRFEADLLADLTWLGLHWEEGPDKGGPFGPYRQSERLDLYREYTRQLLENGHAYYCYCSDEELEQDREALLSRGLPPRYTGRCRNLTDEDRIRMEREGKKPAIRFRALEETIQFDDLIRGTVSFPPNSIGDFIVMRSTGVPSYNLAAVVDDALMKITHVIRGEDHISNTPRQIMLYRVFGFPPPRFAHHSLIVGKDRAKLSKRQGMTTVRSFREAGYLPGALLNYLGILGGNFSGDGELLDAEQMKSRFELSLAGRKSAVFDLDKLNWINTGHLRQLPPEQALSLMKPFLEKAGLNPDDRPHAWLLQMVEAVMPNLTTLEDAAKVAAFLFKRDFPLSESAKEALKTRTAVQVLEEVRDLIRRNPNQSGLDLPSLVALVQKRTGAKGKQLYQPLRAALTGEIQGPELIKVYPLLDQEAILERLDRGIALCYS
jgi:nondiscriminating glutamyl-tRNA synthetase